MIDKQTKERFWKKVDRNGSTGCWLWTASTSHGYGAFGMSRPRRIVRAHRVSWELAHGPIPSGMSVLHSCDVRNCVNPKHLWLGTQADNLRDAAAKGRLPPPPLLRGERSRTAKLTAANVREIRERYANGEARNQIASAFNIVPNHVWVVATRRAWKWLK